MLHVDTESVGDAAEALALLFARDNPRFDRERFFVACGVRPAPVKRVPSKPTAADVFLSALAGERAMRS
jgi:hypothetical protein